MKLCINIRDVSEHCSKGFQGQRSNVQGHSKTKCTFAAEAYISKCGFEAQLF